VHHGDVGRPDRLARYVWRRLTRIYPIYWALSGVVCLVAAFSPDRAARLAPWHVIQSLLLIPESVDPVISVAWTLQHEMLFYIAFACAILRRGNGLLLAVLCVLLVGLGVLEPTAGRWLTFIESPFHLQFLLGIAAARLLARGNVRWPRLTTVAGVAIFLTCGVMENTGWFLPYGLASHLLFGVASTIILLGVVSSERRGFLRIGPAGLLFGGASYSLYLVHPLVVGLAARGFAKLGVLVWAPESAVVLVMVAGAMTVAAGIYLRVESPVMVAIRNARAFSP
jgi:peptidoglycan/LPS O-acetylase OafA/YrhL